MLGFGAALVPQCGYYGLATVIPFVVGSVFADAGIDFDHKKLIASLPSPQTLQRQVTELAIDTIMLTF